MGGRPTPRGGRCADRPDDADDLEESTLPSFYQFQNGRTKLAVSVGALWLMAPADPN